MAKFSGTLRPIHKKAQISPALRPFKSGNTWLKYKGLTKDGPDDAHFGKLKMKTGITGASVELDKNIFQKALDQSGQAFLDMIKMIEILEAANRIKVGSTNQG